MTYGGGGPLSALLGLASTIFWVAAGAIALLVLLGLLFLLVRFLWFGTRAAQLYLAKNGESPRFAWPPSAFEVQEGGPASPAAPRRPKAKAPSASPETPASPPEE